MGERTSYTPGTFSWTDLSTSDADGALRFYTGLFPWEPEDVPIPGGGVYTMLRLDGKAAGAISAARAGQMTAWLSYVTVEDVDAAAGRAGELGGTVHAEPFDVMEAGRMAVLQDPTGAVFALWQPRDSIGAEIVNGPGALSLTQLNTSDPGRAKEFYTGLFDWRVEQVQGGDQPYWGVFMGDRANAGMMQLPAGSPAPPHWLVYFGTDDIDTASERIGQSGGTVMVPKTEVPGGHIVVAQDPQGAVFGLFAGRFDD
ncbi:MAG TPA: VOC family protein [Thermoleophilaceae bacterium]|jgi:predicted enzyme related to lactoylglutathione lyase